MSGLEYICIKWNFSQSFLAEMLGVTRQAVSDWFSGKTGLTNKRTVELMEFFGLEENLLGELTPESRKAINGLLVYRHKKGNHEFYLHRIDDRYIVSLLKGKPIPAVLKENITLLLPNDDVPSSAAETDFDEEPVEPISPDDKLNTATKDLNDLLERLRVSVNDTGISIGSRTFRAVHLVNTLMPLVEVYEKINEDKVVKNYPYKMVYRHVIEELAAGIGLAFGVIDANDLPDDSANEFPPPSSERQMAIDRAYSWNKRFAQTVETLVNAEISSRCKVITGD